MLCACAKSLQLCPISLQLYGLQPARLLYPLDSPGKNTGVGCHSLLQGIFLTQGSKLGLLCFLPWQAGSLPASPPGKPKDSRGNIKREEVPGVVMYTMGGCQGQLLFKKEEKQVAKLCSFIQEIFTEGIPWQSSGQDSMLSLLKAWVQSLVRELRSHKPCSKVKKKKKIY